ncbi:MAG: HAMP domain-containing protein [Gemmatimonadota bacterium]|nr:HAMP domain-containing protein [Gemmatimonadota bacterium]
MDLRTKLVFGLVAVSLVGLAALGTLAYTSAAALTTRRSELRLSTLAEARAEQVESVFEGWSEAVRQVTTRTQLRLSLDSWNQRPSQSEARRMAQIVGDAESGSSFIEALAVLDAAGGVVATAGTVEGSLLQATWADPTHDDVVWGGFTGDDPPRLRFAAPLLLDGGRIGTLRGLLSTTELAGLAEDVTGLGETGETLIVVRFADGQLALLGPRRIDETASVAEGSILPQPLVDLAFGDTASLVREGIVDHRGERVWAASHPVQGEDVGIVVKLDEAEETADIEAYRELLLGAGFSLSAFAILLGVLMGFSLAKPIQALAGVADRIREGDLTARADEQREDELGLLARTFNEMSVELERRMTLLEEYKTFFDESRDLLCIARTDGYFELVNPAFSRVLGWDSEELLDKPFVAFVHPDDVAATIAETARLGEGIPTVSFENRYRCKDGTYKHLRWAAHPDPATGLLYATARVLPVK